MWEGFQGELVAGDFCWIFDGFLAGEVVRAGFLACVTAENAFGFADLGGYAWRNFAVVFDSVIGDAFVCVDNSGCDDCAGWAGINTAGAGAAGHIADSGTGM